ncbi:MAG: tetratricopeptide repeat protein [Elusimicrobiota bacterium]
MNTTENAEQKITNGIKSFFEWSFSNIQTIGIASAIIIGAILIGSVFVLRQKEAHETQLTNLAIAEKFIGQKQYPNAEKILTEIKNKNPKKNVLLPTLYYLGDIATHSNSLDKALEYLNEAKGISNNSPFLPLILSNIGFVYEEKKDFSSAADTYRQFMNSFSEHFMSPRIQYSLGKTLVLSGKNDEGRKELERLVDLYPSSKWAEKSRIMMDKSKTR